MKFAISVELDGTTFALEEPAYCALRAYMDRAGERLGAHPDRAEVVAGLERSIGAKLRSRAQGAGPVDEAAMQAALKEVGRVDGPMLDDSSPPSSEPDHRARTLCRVREGSWIAGVCTGLAVYFGVDVTVTRLVFVLAAMFSGGIVILVYVLFAFLLPISPADAGIGGARGSAPPR